MISQIITCVSLVVSDEALRQESHHERCNEGGQSTIKDGCGRKQEELFCSCDWKRNSSAPGVFLPVLPTPLPPITAIFMTRLDSELSGAGHSAIVVMLWMRRMVSSWVKPERSRTDGKIKAQLVRAEPAVGAAGGALSPRSGSESEGSRQEERLGPETSGELKRRRGARRLYSALPALLSDWLLASPSRFPPPGPPANTPTRGRERRTQAGISSRNRWAKTGFLRKSKSEI